MKKHLLLLLGLPFITLTACDSVESGNATLPPAEKIELTDSESRAATHINNFGIDFFAKASAEHDAENKNLTISPLSISLLASVVANACDEQDAANVGAALGCESLETLNSYSAKLMNKLSNIDPTSAFISSNSLWLQSGLNVRPDFADPAKRFYGIEFFERDFQNIDKVKEDVRSWVSSKTKGVIDDYIVHIDNLTSIAIFNVIYFKGIWAAPFDASKTTKKTFNGSAGASMVDMMYNSSKYGYAQNTVCDAVALDFGNGAFEAVLILPKENESMTAHDLSTILNAEFNYLTEVRLSCPKFEYRERNFNASSIIADMGVNLNSLKILEEKISEQCDVKQDTYIRFYEEGVELAAVTGLTDSTAMPPTSVEMNFNRPFYFFVREHSTQAILIAGHINNINSSSTI